MTDRQEIFDRINELLENTGVGFEMKDESDLEEFLENEENQQYDEYEEIEGLYSELMEYTNLDEE